jgi:hypothetical protein
MATNDWQAMGAAKMRGKIPLLDLLSLMVLSDLGLLEPLFKLFPRNAIGKATMMKLQELLAPLSGSLYRHKLLPIQAALKIRFAEIEQPEAEPPTEDKFIKDHWDSLEIVEIAKGGKYLIYSDDVTFRIYSQQPAICTLDILGALDETGQLSARDAATKIATLCSWRVGLTITPRYQLAILPDALGTAKSFTQGVDAIMNDQHSNALFSGIWNPEKKFKDILGHGGATLRELIENGQNDIRSIAALAGYWLGKARLHKEAPTPTDRVAAFLIVQAIILDRPLSEEAAHRLWNVYGNLIEYAHGNYMDAEKDRQSFRVMGETAAEIDKQHSIRGDKSLRSKLSIGLTKGTSDYDLFNEAYMSTLSASAIQQPKK